MRILALQTDVGEIKKKFLVEGEEEFVTTSHHPCIFFITLAGTTILAIIFTGLLALGFDFVADASLRLGMVAIFGVGILYCCYHNSMAYINWRFNFLIVTAEKIIIVDQHSLIRQRVTPIHLDNIASTRFELQFFGILRCGIVYIRLREGIGGDTREIAQSYIPKPDVVTGAIEKAMALEKKRTKHEETPQEQLPKVQEVKQDIAQDVKQEPDSFTENKTTNPPGA